MNLLYLFLLSLTLFQVTDGEISVTLVDENESPIAQERLEFVTEEQQVLASCVTNSQGRCTITIQNAPTDASGFIRGGLLLGDRGRRPIIWPGGQIEIQIMLGGGKVDVPSDLYVTRTPKPEATPTEQEQLPATPEVQEQLPATPEVQEQLTATPEVQEQITATPEVQEQLPATPEVQEQLTATPEVQEQITATPEVQEQLTATPEVQEQLTATPTVQGQPSATLTQTYENEGILTLPFVEVSISNSILLQIALIVILILALGFYIWSSNKKS